MQIILNKNLENRIEELLRQLELNQEAADFYNSYLENSYDFITKAMINDIKSDGSSEEEAFYQCILNTLEVTEDQELEILKSTCQIDKVKLLDDKDYRNDPYLKNINPVLKTQKRWKITTNYYQPYEGFIFDEMKTGDNFAEISSLGFFNNKYTFPEVLKNDEVFMLITPHEINTMRKPLSLAKGKILVIGLGLGYFSYMASLKKEVNEIIVIESEQEVIDLYKTCIEPQIKNKKIKIVKADAFKYLQIEAIKQNFDFAFFDIYHNASEAIPFYFKAKKLASKLKNTEFTYWIENDIVCLLRRYLLTLIAESINGFTDEDYSSVSTQEDEIINHLYQVTKDTVISSVEQLEEFLSAENIKNLIN